MTRRSCQRHGASSAAGHPQWLRTPLMPARRLVGGPFRSPCYPRADAPTWMICARSSESLVPAISRTKSAICRVSPFDRTRAVLTFRDTLCFV
jgi:hypothetical protein